MKKILFLMITIVFALVLSACNINTVSQGATQNGQSVKTEVSQQEVLQPSSSQSALTEGNSQQDKTEPVSSNEQSVSETKSKISRDEAVNIALKKAGFGKNQVRELEAELDYERKTLVWEVDFEKGNKEYSYEIDALSGEILRTETEND